MQHVRTLFKNSLLLGALIAGVMGLLVPVTTVAQTSTGNKSLDAACEGLVATGATTTCGDEAAAEDSFTSVITSIINILSIVVGAVSVIMIIIGGFRYIISNGDSNGVQGAKNTILYAIVGLVIVLFAQIIVQFVLTNASSTPPEEEGAQAGVHLA